MTDIIKQRYDPKLSVKDNAVNCGVSQATLRLWLRQHNIDRHFDAMYVRFKTIKQWQKRNPLFTPQYISKKTGYSLNTVKKYMRLKKMEKEDCQNVISIFDTSKEATIIKSVSFDQQEILTNILKLHVPSKEYDADFTYSIGVFYNGDIIKAPLLKFDKYPQMEGVAPLEDAEKIEDGTLNSCVVDLPFIISSEKWIDGSKMAQRFNYFDNLDEAIYANKMMLNLSYRKLKRRGILVFKTMDLYKPTGQIWMSRYVQEFAEEIGFDLIDTFILIAKSKVLGKGMSQKVARKYHSYFFVFRKK